MHRGRPRRWSMEGRRGSRGRGGGARMGGKEVELGRAARSLSSDDVISGASIEKEARSAARRRSQLRRVNQAPKLCMRRGPPSACIEVHLLHASRRAEEVELGWAARRWSSEGRRGHRAPAKSSSAKSKLTLLSGEVQADALSGEDQDLPEALNPLYLEPVVPPAVTSRKTALAGGQSGLEGGAKSSSASEVISDEAQADTPLRRSPSRRSLRRRPRPPGSFEPPLPGASGPAGCHLPEDDIGRRAERPGGQSDWRISACRAERPGWLRCRISATGGSRPAGRTAGDLRVDEGGGKGMVVWWL